MRTWLRRHRAHLIVLPVALAVAFGWQFWRAYTGNDQIAHRAVDVPSNTQTKVGPLTVELLDMSRTGTSKGNAGTPETSVNVLAKFRVKIDAKKRPKYLLCETGIENAEGWKWETSAFSGIDDDDLPPKVSGSCDGSYYGEDGDEIEPPLGQWYQVWIAYKVPKSQATGLRPTMSHQKDLPEYKRFEP